MHARNGTTGNAGEDRSLAAFRLNRVLCDAGLIAPGARWQPLAGGRTNLVWRLGGAAPDGDLVCKLSPAGRDTPLFPNRPRDEAMVLRHLAGSGLAPELIATLVTGMGHCLLYRHVDGSVGAATAEMTRIVLNKLHGTPPPAGLPRLSATPAALLSSGDAILQRLTPAARAPLVARRPVETQVQTDEAALLHGDPVPGNILATASGTCLLDLQCPAIGDPVLDFAIALSPAMNTLERGAVLSDRDRATLLTDPGVAHRFYRLEPFLVWRMAAYCAWRIQHGAEAYRPAMAAELERLDCLPDP